MNYSTKPLVTVLLTCSLFTMAACEGSQKSGASAAAPEVKTVETAPAVTPSAQADPTLTVDGYNNTAMIGDKLDSSGLIFNPDEGPECVYARRAQSDYAVLFVAIDGAIARIDVRKGDLALDNGLKIGSSSADIEAAYGVKAQAFPNKYDPDAVDFTVNISKTRAAAFELTNDAVTRYRVGRPAAVMLSEGCS